MNYCKCGRFGIEHGDPVARVNGGMSASEDNRFPNTQFEEVHTRDSCKRYEMAPPKEMEP